MNTIHHGRKIVSSLRLLRWLISSFWWRITLVFLVGGFGTYNPFPDGNRAVVGAFTPCSLVDQRIPFEAIHTTTTMQRPNPTVLITHHQQPSSLWSTRSRTTREARNGNNHTTNRANRASRPIASRKRQPAAVQLEEYVRTQATFSASPPSFLSARSLSSDAAATAAATNGIRLNKVFRATHSRRQADQLIADGRVAINGTTVHDMGRRVVPYCDVVSLDGTVYSNWEARQYYSEDSDPNHLLSKHNNNYYKPDASISSSSSVLHPTQEDYLKFWKPVGVVSTTDRLVANNLLHALEELFDKKKKRQRVKDSSNQNDTGWQHRIFSVGRLDKDSSGLLLLTSDGRIPNAVLRKQGKHPKVYQVRVHRPISNADLQRLRQGIVITTDTVRQGKHVPRTAPTLPCRVRRIPYCSDHHQQHWVEMTLREGRNRQIRVMMQTLGYRVVELHRTHFLGIDLSGLEGPGDFASLNEEERALLERAVVGQQTSITPSAKLLDDTIQESW